MRKKLSRLTRLPYLPRRDNWAGPLFQQELQVQNNFRLQILTQGLVHKQLLYCYWIWNTCKNKQRFSEGKSQTKEKYLRGAKETITHALQEFQNPPLKEERKWMLANLNRNLKKGFQGMCDRLPSNSGMVAV